MLTDNHASELTREQFTSVFRLKDCRSRCFVEATPANIRSRKAPRILFGLMTAAERAASKFLLVVREPVSRDISYFNHFHANRREERLYNIAFYEEHTRRRLLAYAFVRSRDVCVFNVVFCAFLRAVFSTWCCVPFVCVFVSLFYDHGSVVVVRGPPGYIY